jgi:hypothetical protein
LCWRQPLARLREPWSSPSDQGLDPRRDASPPWTPPSCTGWTAKGAGVLVALAARFSYGGSADALLARFAAISTLKGLRRWSVTEGVGGR